MSSSSSAASPVRLAQPGDGVLHPAVILAVSVMVLNDHVFKVIWPSVLTGKVSDVAGLFFFPLAVQALYEFVTIAVGRPRVDRGPVLVIAIIVTGASFSLMKLSPSVGDIYRGLLGDLQWLVGLPLAIVSGSTTTSGVVRMTPDPTDLVALPVLGLAYLLGRARAKRL